MSIVYSTLFGQTIQEYVSYAFPGFVAWYFIATILNESPAQFAGARGLLYNSNFPIEIISLRVVWRNFVTVLMALPFVVLASVALGGAVEPSILLFPAGVSLLLITAVPTCYLVGLLGVRFPDISVLMPPLTLVIMLVTPIFWPAESLSTRAWVYEFNPFYWFVSLVRGPLTVDPPAPLIWAGCAVVAGLLWGVAILVAPRQFNAVKMGA